MVTFGKLMPLDVQKRAQQRGIMIGREYLISSASEQEDGAISETRRQRFDRWEGRVLRLQVQGRHTLEHAGEFREHGS